MGDFNPKSMGQRLQQSLKNMTVHYSTLAAQDEQRRAAIREKFFADKWMTDYIVHQLLKKMREV